MVRSDAMTWRRRMQRNNRFLFRIPIPWRYFVFYVLENFYVFISRNTAHFPFPRKTSRKTTKRTKYLCIWNISCIIFVFICLPFASVSDVSLAGCLADGCSRLCMEHKKTTQLKLSPATLNSNHSSRAERTFFE